MPKTAELSEEAWKWLTNKKTELKAKSINEVVTILINDRIAAEWSKSGKAPLLPMPAEPAKA